MSLDAGDMTFCRTMFSHGLELPADGYEKMFPGLAPHQQSRCQIQELARTMVMSPPGPECLVDDNPNIPAGYTYLGQFIAHDISHMRGPENLVSPMLNLDTVYGADRQSGRHLFKQNCAGDDVFRIGLGAETAYSSGEEDLPRSDSGKAEIPDSRNDFHFIISQLHLAFLRLHNRLTGELRCKFAGQKPAWIFETARSEVTWHYQWVVVNDYLRRLCDPDVFAKIWRDGVHREFMPKAGAPPQPKLPYEFVLAGFRFGHSMVRPCYAINQNIAGDKPIFHPLTDENASNSISAATVNCRWAGPSIGACSSI